jgi:Tfp pilus assembly protein PilV
MTIYAFILVALLLLIAGVTTTSSLFCMRERNTANARYKDLYEKWQNQIEDITDLQMDYANAQAQAEYWEKRYNDTLPTPETTITDAPIPQV